MSLLEIIGFGLWLLTMVLLFIGTWYVHKHFLLPPKVVTPNRQLGISILKPLKGLDPGLEENLRSFFEICDENSEIIFSVADPSDPAISIVEKLMTQYQNKNSRLLIGHQHQGDNPKVVNLIDSYQLALHEWILVSDSNIMAGKAYLETLRAHINNEVGIVTAVVLGFNAKGMGGYLESVYLNTFYARWLILSDKFGFSCVLGKSMLFKKSVMNQIGGIKTFRGYIAEDYMAGVAIKYLGKDIKILNVPVIQNIGTHSFKNFWLRHLRWGRIRKSQAPLAFLGEGLQNCFVSASIGYLWAVPSGLMTTGHFFSVHFSLWFFADFLVMKKLNTHGINTSIAWFIREFLAFPLWLHTQMGKSVNWRGKKLKLLKGGLLESKK